MRTGSMFVALGSLLGFIGALPADAAERSERLLGSNENPPVISDGRGNFRADIGDNQISFRLRYNRLETGTSDVTQAHIHIANPGNNGGITVFLCSNAGNTPQGTTERACPPSAGEVVGDIVADDVQETTTEVDGVPVTVIEAGDLDGLAKLMRQGATYINVHTDDHPAGEIRGQVEPRER